MTQHFGKIKCEYAGMIASGDKILEGRQLDNKWSKVEEGDTIKFEILHTHEARTHCIEHLEVEIKKKTIYNNINEMIANGRHDMLLPGTDVETAEKIYKNIYPNASKMIAFEVEMVGFFIA